MATTDLVSPNAIIPAMKVNGKKQALQEIAAKAAELTGQNEKAILEILLQREKLGSTAFGGGVAIPHARLAGLDRIVAGAIRLAQPVDFSAVDDVPVDLMLVLFSPPNAGADHLKALARVARLLRDRGLIAKLRGAGSRDAIWALLTSDETRDAA